ncbi:MAG: hypothetical protein WD063_09930 [Pirellulales bacterium]
MAVTDTSAANLFPEDFAAFEKSGISCSTRLHLALDEFLKAWDYANDLNTNVWDFAIELSYLRRLQLSNSDLRWLVGRGLLGHGIETTSPGDAERSFKRPARLILCKKTRFVLTPKGAEVSRQICGRGRQPAIDLHVPVVCEPPLRAVVPPSTLLVPKWDRDRQELRVGSVVVKRFRVPAASQEAILAAFEEECWPPRIDDPLPPRKDQSPKRRLQETIKSLNRNQKHPLLRFLGDGSAQGVLWEFCGERNGAHDV